MSGTGESSADVQREAESERAELASTLDQLRENLKPANVVDEVMAGAKVTTAEVTDWMWGVARNNPVPATLIGIGAAMLLGVSQVAGRRQAARPSGEIDRESPSYPYDAAEDDLRDRSPDASRSSFRSDRMSSAERGAEAATRRIADSARALRSQATHTAWRSNQAMPRTAGERSMTQYGRSRDRITQSVSRLFEDQPLVLAALGVAVGAAIGAAIPATEAEGRLMGDASAQVKSRAQAIAAAEYAHLKDTASATVDDLKQTAVDHGVSTENLSGLVRDAGARVKDAAGDVATHAAGSAGLQT